MLDPTTEAVVVGPDVVSGGDEAMRSLTFGGERASRPLVISVINDNVVYYD